MYWMEVKCTSGQRFLGRHRPPVTRPKEDPFETPRTGRKRNPTVLLFSSGRVSWILLFPPQSKSQSNRTFPWTSCLTTEYVHSEVKLSDLRQDRVKIKKTVKVNLKVSLCPIDPKVLRIS